MAPVIPSAARTGISAQQATQAIAASQAKRFGLLVFTVDLLLDDVVKV